MTLTKNTTKNSMEETSFLGEQVGGWVLLFPFQETRCAAVTAVTTVASFHFIWQNPFGPKLLAKVEKMSTVCSRHTLVACLHEDSIRKIFTLPLNIHLAP